MAIAAQLDRAAEAAFELKGNAVSWMQSIEGLRGLGAFMVFLVHYATLVKPWVPPESSIFLINETLFSMGNVGVDVFFAISGFLIYAMLIRRERPLLPYFRRRVMRIYPVFLAVMLIYTALSLALPEQSKIPTGETEATGYLIANYLLLPGILDIEPMITVAWSLSYEMFFYLAMPLLLPVFRLRQAPPRVRVFFWFAVWVVVYLAVPQHFRASMFIAGIMVYETAQVIARDRSSPLLTLFALAAFAAVLAFKTSIHFDFVTFEDAGKVNQVALFGACYLLCLAVFCKDGWLSRFFSRRYLRYFGNMSYSFYLIHGLTLKFFFLILGVLLPPESYGGVLWFWVLFLPALATATAVSAGLFLLVERPFSLDGIGLRSLVRSRLTLPS
jgi:peptidoglycan/LPS O-acetylase OafA/YrhL